MGIPKVILQTSVSKPPHWLVRKTLAKADRGWKYVHFTDEDIFRFFEENRMDEFKNIDEKFRSIRNGAHKSDLFRYFYLLINGGLYFDTDVALAKSVDSIVKDYTFVSVASTHVPNTMFQGFLGAAPDHEIIYRAAKDAYNIDLDALAKDSKLICRNMFTFYKDYVREHSDEGIKIYDEKRYRKWVAKVVDDDGKVLLYHYWKKPFPPRYGLREKILDNRIFDRSA